ncbi:hydrolase TatD [Amycolatopsis sp.]|jgi:hypothetical protein|uniref:TatD family hydrolase n=1 Tax=Amycolatopsis sp. TaxID=37632 RepID=UPI002E035DA2|nr:hydrolase TatD [Amycolatopsis sp.]
MRIFDPHIHMTSRTTDDYENMYRVGVRALVEPAFWLGQPRTGVVAFTDYFDSLIGWERFRAAMFGIRHHCTIALNPKEANDPRCVEVLDVLPRYPALVVVDHLNEPTVGLVTDSGRWMGFSIYPDTKMDEHRMVALLREYGTSRVLVNSAADWGRSDPLKTHHVGVAMLETGFSESDVDTVLWRNPVEFYGQSGRLVLDELPGFTASTDVFAGNSVLRGGGND